MTAKRLPARLRAKRGDPALEQMLGEMAAALRASGGDVDKADAALGWGKGWWNFVISQAASLEYDAELDGLLALVAEPAAPDAETLIKTLQADPALAAQLVAAFPNWSPA